MKKRSFWLVTWTAAAILWLVAGTGAAPLAAEEGWCCRDGELFAATPEACKEKGGAWFANKDEAEKYCRQEPAGWCCLNGVIVAGTPELCKEKGGMFFWNRDEAEKACLGYCCYDGAVIAMSAATCKEKGGAWFATQAEAERFCRQAPPEGWCCRDGAVFAATPAQCKEKGGAWFATQAEAERFCRQAPPEGWCCRDGAVFAATPAQCKEKGGAWFANRARAERFCRGGEKLPDLVVKDITLDRSCQVVVTLANAGPGMIPDTVWTVHAPTSCSVYLFVNGRKWGGKTVWSIDPGKLLQPAGGTVRYVSSLIVSAEAEITAVIDPTGEVAETDEDNNKLVKKVKCAATTEPILLR